MLKKLLFFSLSLFVHFIYASNITFFLTSDPHYGYSMWENDELINKKAIAEMNTLPGQAFPPVLKEFGLTTVAEPLGVIVSGDLTGKGSCFDWGGYFLRSGFNQDYEVNGNGLLRYPVFEGYGNHDVDPGGTAVLNGIKMRNRQRNFPIHLSANGLHYSWDWQNIHFVQLNVFPGETKNAKGSLAFLKQDLAQQVKNSGRKVVLIHHYEFEYEPEVWFTPQAQAAYYEVIKPYSILAIFAGHTHQTHHYLWKGIPVFVAPSVKDNAGYLVVTLQNDVLVVAERMAGQWANWWSYVLHE